MCIAYVSGCRLCGVFAVGVTALDFECSVCVTAEDDLAEGSVCGQSLHRSSPAVKVADRNTQCHW